jgi:TolA-binding protein
MIRKDKNTEEILIAEKDIEAVKNDPQYSEAGKLASKLVTDFMGKTLGNNLNERFIKENFAEADTSFHIDAKPDIKKVIMRYFTLAAFVAGVVFMVRFFLPSSDTDRLFERFYAPMNLVSGITRGQEPVTDTLHLETAINYYRSGDYEKALDGFSKLGQGEIPEGNSLFYMGITRLAVKDYDGASTLLQKALSYEGDYFKEAKWYLGLSYLKTGEKEKAAECFESLSQMPGYYRKSSQKILRLLK